jgi:hypothetical protein
METIKKALIYSCVHKQAIYFLPFLFHPSVKVQAVSKIRFFNCLKRMIHCMDENSTGKISLRIKEVSWLEGNVLAYGFYDEIHTYSRLTIHVTETEEMLHLDILPF